MSDTQQSLSKIKENYEKIRNDMETNDLNDIISDSSDELFAGLKEIVFSKKNTINIQNDIRRIARSLEDKYKKLKKDDDKYTQEITDITKDITDKTAEKVIKDAEIETNKGPVTGIQKIEEDIKQKKIDKTTEEGNIKTKEGERKAKDIAIKENEVKLRKTNDEIRAKEGERSDSESDLRQPIKDLKLIKEIIKEQEKELKKATDPDDKKEIEKDIKESEKEKADYEATIKKLGGERDDAIAAIKKLKSERSNITTDISDLNGEKNDKRREAEEAKENKKDIENEIKNLEQEAKTLGSKNEALLREVKGIDTEITSLKTKTKEIQEKEQTNKNNMESLENVMKTHKNIAEIADMFDTDKDLKEQTIKPNTTGTVATLQDFLRDTSKKPGNLAFEFYDGEDKKVTGNKIKNIKLKSGVTVNIEGITINNNGEVIRNNAKVTDTTTDKEVTDYPLEFELEIGAKTIYTGSLQESAPNRDIAITNKKILKVKFDVDYLDQTGRKAEVIAYNNSGTGNVIQQSLTENHNILVARLEREAVFRGLEKADGPKFNKLTPEQKETLYQDVRTIYRTTSPARAANLANMDNFGTGPVSFLDWITGDKHESNKPEFTKSGKVYREHIHNILEDQIKKYFEWRFDEMFSNNIDGNTYLKTHLTNYLSDIEHQKIDNDVHRDILGDVGANKEMKNRRAHSIDIGEETYGIGRKDVNYLRFFAGVDSKTEAKDQIVNITTNDKPEDLNNPEPVKYDMDMEVSGKQQILVNIKIDKQKEIKLKAGDPASIIKRILQCQEIKYGKVRAHVVYNVIKGFIDAAKKKDISLNYRDPGTGNMMMIKMDGKNIVLEDQDDQTNYGGNYRRNTTVLFDHQAFESTNTFDATQGNENRRLRVGIDKLMGHFNYAMEELHTQYRQASERKWMGLKRGETRMTLPTSFFLSPIKKILNFRTTTKFDFSTNVQSNGKSISVEFKKNKFTLNMDGLKKPISSRTLGKLLRYRQGGVRVFDGMERDICGKIYEELINKMRENTKIARTNFGVKDAVTGRIYILDADGQLGYVSAEQAAEDKNMVRKGRLSKREYGIVNNPPVGRRMCDESETREVMKNPYLMGKIIKTMNNRMGLISSTRAMLN